MMGRVSTVLSLHEEGRFPNSDVLYSGVISLIRSLSISAMIERLMHPGSSIVGITWISLFTVHSDVLILLGGSRGMQGIHGDVST